MLRQKKEYTPFLASDATWKKIDPDELARGFTDDADNGKKKEDKFANLEDMLSLICQFVPSYLATDIEKNTTCFADIWSIIRKYCNLRQTETNFMKFNDIVLEEGE